MRKLGSTPPEFHTIKQTLRDARGRYSNIDNALCQTNKNVHSNDNHTKLQNSTTRPELRALITIIDALVGHLEVLSQTMDPFSQQFEDTKLYMDIGKRASVAANQRIRTMNEVEDYDRNETSRN